MFDLIKYFNLYFYLPHSSAPGPKILFQASGLGRKLPASG